MDTKKAKKTKKVAKVAACNFSALPPDDLLAAEVPDADAPIKVVASYCSALWHCDQANTQETKRIRWRIGKTLLLRRKSEVGKHGNWKAYIEANFPFSYHTARRFLMFAEQVSDTELEGPDSYHKICQAHDILGDYRQPKKPAKKKANKGKTEDLTVPQYSKKIKKLGQDIADLLLQTPKLRDSFHSPTNTAGTLQQAEVDVVGYIQSLKDLAKAEAKVRQEVEALKVSEITVPAQDQAA